MRTRILSGTGMILGVLLIASPALGQSRYLKSTEKGDPQIKSIQAIAFGPQGLLVIGDGASKQVVIVDTGDTKTVPWSMTKIPNIEDKLAARLGTTGDGIEILKIAVNPASQKVYFAVRKKDDKKSLILTVDGNGKVNELVLDNVTFARVQLSPEGGTPISNITDVVWAGKRILVAAQAREIFASKFFTIPVPLQTDSSGAIFSTETFHVAHNRWETKAPLRTIMPYQEKGKDYLVGAFTCTPVVKYELEKLQPGAKVKGQSVIEVGSGNQPRDMFAYEKGGKKYILMSTYRFHHKRRPVGPSPYWTVKIEFELLSETEKVNQLALKRVNRKYESITDRAVVVPSFHGVAHMGQLDNERAVALRINDNDNLDLEVLPLP